VARAGSGSAGIPRARGSTGDRSGASGTLDRSVKF
jgi:hypothetical protein